MTNTLRPVILGDYETIDTLSQPESVEVLGRDLRRGMVLLDPEEAKPEPNPFWDHGTLREARQAVEELRGPTIQKGPMEFVVLEDREGYEENQGVVKYRASTADAYGQAMSKVLTLDLNKRYKVMAVARAGPQ